MAVQTALDEKLGQQNGKINKIIREIENLNQKKASKKEVKHLTERLDKFSELEHMDYLQRVLLPKLNGFSGKIDGFLKEIDDVKTSTRQFDETMSLKANKAELKIHRERCEKRFVSQDLWTQIQTKFAALSDGIKNENADLDKRIN